MVEADFQSIFLNAALPQKMVWIALLAAVPVVCFCVLSALREEAKSAPWKRVISLLLIGGPMAGLLLGAMNVTVKQLAPGILEVSVCRLARVCGSRRWRRASGAQMDVGAEVRLGGRFLRT